MNWTLASLGGSVNKGAVMSEKMGECHGVCFVSSASPLSHNVSYMNLTTSPDSCISNAALMMPV